MTDCKYSMWGFDCSFVEATPSDTVLHCSWPESSTHHHIPEDSNCQVPYHHQYFWISKNSIEDTLDKGECDIQGIYSVVWYFEVCGMRSLLLLLMTWERWDRCVRYWTSLTIVTGLQAQPLGTLGSFLSVGRFLYFLHSFETGAWPNQPPIHGCWGHW